MSISPGTTSFPRASITSAVPAAISVLTAMIRPPPTATSRTASSPRDGSMTRPPLMTRSYAVAASKLRPQADKAAPRQKSRRVMRELLPRLVVPLTDDFAVGHLRADEAGDRSPARHWMDLDRDLGPRRKCRRTNPFTPQLVRAAPLDAPFHHFAVRIGNVHLD